MQTFEILRNGSFVITKNEKDEIVFGGYHDVYTKDGEKSRIFEAFAPIEELTLGKLFYFLQAIE